MKKQLREYSITNFEIQNLFRAKLTQEQIYFFSVILKILSKYMVLDRSMLEFYARGKIGLSYFTNCTNYGLITELKYRDDKEEKDIYYFHLNTAGINFAEMAGFLVNKLPITSNQFDKSRIVTFNKWAIAEKINLVNEVGAVGTNCKYFIANKKDCEKQIACFYRELANEKYVAKALLQRLNSIKVKDEKEYIMEDVYNKYTFQEINCELIAIGNKSCGSEYSLLEDI